MAYLVRGHQFLRLELELLYRSDDLFLTKVVINIYGYCTSQKSIGTTKCGSL